MIGSNTNGGLWAVYTAHKHKFQYRVKREGEDRDAVGIISGGAPCDRGLTSSISSREKSFPTDLIRKSRTIKIESAQASQEADRLHILNSIVENKNLNVNPPKSHPNYEKVNDAIKGAFAASMPALHAAAIAGGDEWTETLDCLSKGIRTGTFKLDFPSFSPRLSSAKARELLSHIPVTCDGLDIMFAEGEDCVGAIEGMIEWMGKAKTMKYLTCSWCRVGNVEGGRDVGRQLAAALGSSHHATSIEYLRISWTDLIVSENVSEWALALRKMTALETLWLSRVDEYISEGVGGLISDEEMNILCDATHASTIGGI